MAVLSVGARCCVTVAVLFVPACPGFRSSWLGAVRPCSAVALSAGGAVEGLPCCPVGVPGSVPHLVGVSFRVGLGSARLRLVSVCGCGCGCRSAAAVSRWLLVPARDGSVMACLGKWLSVCGCCRCPVCWCCLLLLSVGASACGAVGGCCVSAAPLPLFF